MASASPFRGVDTHAHVFSADALPVAGARYRPAYAATLDAWRALWSASGITHGVITQVSFFGTDNRELLAAIARAPSILRGAAGIDPGFDDAALRALDAGGVRALRLNLSGAADYSPYGDAAWRALYARAAALGWHAEVFVDAGRLPELVPVFEGTAIPIVLDHFGNPGAGARAAEATLDAAARLARTRAVWCKLSAPYRLAPGSDPARLAAQWLALLGPDRLVWGSDWPWTRQEAGRNYAELAACLDRWVAPEVARAVLWDNPARLYRFD
jgi:predicted TIM-barrel fold metal-dependent hydrolase